MDTKCDESRQAQCKRGQVEKVPLQPRKWDPKARNGLEGSSWQSGDTTAPQEETARHSAAPSVSLSPVTLKLQHALPLPVEH